MSDKAKPVYIVLWTHKVDITKQSPYIGFLPFGKVPVNSILWDALRSGDIGCEDGGFRGIYDELKYAKEHIKLEKKWRDIPCPSRKVLFKIVSNSFKEAL